MNTKCQTRGRPKKKIDQKLPQISRILFSQHCAVFYACCMMYVLQTFIKTKHQKRIGHSQGGFTIYQRVNQTYSFENIQKDCKLWGFNRIIKNQYLMNFVKIANGSAPKFIFKQILHLIDEIIIFIDSQQLQTIQDLEQNQFKLWNRTQNQLNKKYKYIRFTYSALKQLKMQKWNNQVSSKIKQLWEPFLIIISYTIFCLIKNIPTNKYLKPFFSDAQNPQETIIGQLNLHQIVNPKFYHNQKKSPSKLTNSREIHQNQIYNQSKKYISLNYQLKKRNIRIQSDQNRFIQSQRNSSPQKSLQRRNSAISLSGNIRAVTFITHPSLQKISVQKISSNQEQENQVKSLNLNSSNNQQYLIKQNSNDQSFRLQNQGLKIQKQRQKKQIINYEGNIQVLKLFQGKKRSFSVILSQQQKLEGTKKIKQNK